MSLTLARPGDDGRLRRLTPCPEAIGILLIAIGINRIVLGLGLIAAFSLGLAAVLIYGVG
jgi:ABC-type nickel/cobalt efflux system permease component RcnA